MSTKYVNVGKALRILSAGTSLVGADVYRGKEVLILIFLFRSLSIAVEFMKITGEHSLLCYTRGEKKSDGKVIVGHELFSGTSPKLLSAPDSLSPVLSVHRTFAGPAAGLRKDTPVVPLLFPCWAKLGEDSYEMI